MDDTKKKNQNPSSTVNEDAEVNQNIPSENVSDMEMGNQNQTGSLGGETTDADLIEFYEDDEAAGDLDSDEIGEEEHGEEPSTRTS